MRKDKDILVNPAFVKTTGYTENEVLGHTAVYWRIKKVKIEKSFIQNLLLEKETRVIAKAIIKMAHGINLKVIAEGIESEMEY